MGWNERAQARMAGGLLNPLGEPLAEAKSVDDLGWRKTPEGVVNGRQRKRVGKLGVVTYVQAKAHEDSGIAAHKWLFNQSYGSQASARYPRGRTITQQKCAVCGATRETDAATRKVISKR